MVVRSDSAVYGLERNWRTPELAVFVMRPEPPIPLAAMIFTPLSMRRRTWLIVAPSMTGIIMSVSTIAISCLWVANSDAASAPSAG